MNKHYQTVAVLHLALGVLSVLGALVIFTCLGLAGTLVLVHGEHEAASIIAVVAFAMAAVLTLLGLPGIVGGWALYTGRSWGKPLVLVLGALSLFNIPIGTAIGAYTIWALTQDPIGISGSRIPAGSAQI